MKKTIVYTFLACSMLFNVFNAHAQGITNNKTVKVFIDEMIEKHDFDRAWLEKLFDQTTIQKKIITTMSRPAEKRMAWKQYRNIFIKEKRIKEGVDFYKQHETILKQAAEKFGVPAEIIAAIIGVETFYGKQTGGHQVLDALSTLAFDYPKRAAFFRKELEEFILLVQEESIDPFSLKGSYAGAIGKPQFMPSSYREYAVDFDGDGSRNLQKSWADTVASVAHYLQKHGWKKNAPIIHRGNVSGTRFKTFLEKGLKPSLVYKTLENNGVRISEIAAIPAETLVNFFQMEGENGHEYWIGEHNFYVITRYNHSSMYALAVFQLAESIAEAI